MYGTLSVPTPATISINGVPSVDAIAIPPWFAVVSVEASWFDALVVIPSTISLSLICNVVAFKIAVVPPILMFPDTYKFCPTVKSPKDAVILADGTVPDDKLEAFV